MFYKIRKIYQLSVMVFVEADSRKEALDLSNSASGEDMNDCHLYDAEVIDSSETPFEE